MEQLEVSYSSCFNDCAGFANHSFSLAGSCDCLAVESVHISCAAGQSEQAYLLAGRPAHLQVLTGFCPIASPKKGVSLYEVIA